MMDIVNAIPAFPFVVVALFVGLMFLIGHIHKKSTCDHQLIEFFRFINRPDGRTELAVTCYCKKNVACTVGDLNVEEFRYAGKQMYNHTVRPWVFRIPMQIVAIVLLLTSALLNVLRLKKPSDALYALADAVDERTESDSHEWHYIDRRDERLAKYLDTCDLEVIHTAD